MTKYSYREHISLKTKILNYLKLMLRNKACEQFLIKKNIIYKGRSIAAKIIPQEYLYPKGTIRKYNRNGEKFELDISNVIDHAKYFCYYDPGFENLKKRVKENFVIIDIGANIGITSVAFAKRANLGKVIAFEPSSKTFDRLLKHIKLNNLENILAVNRGIGRKPNEFKLYQVVDSNPGMNRILPEDLTDNNLEFELIFVNSLEKELKKYNVGKVDLIKIDVEGFEFEVIKGAEKIIDRDKPLLFVELDDNNLKQNGSSARDLVNILLEKDYVIKEAISLESLSKNHNFDNCHIDILCEQTEVTKLRV